MCISPTFLPKADSEAFCGAKMVKALMDRKIDVEVFTFGHSYLRQNLCDESSLWMPLNRTVAHYISVPATFRYYSILTAIRYRTITWVRWVDSVIKYAVRCHKEKPFDIVYSRSLPMIAHIAGYWVSRKLKLPWVVNINDPWDWHLFPSKIGVKMSLLGRFISNYWLKKIFRTADLLTFPNKRLCDYHMGIAPSIRPNEIIPHIGYYYMNKYNETSGFHLVHAGKLGINEIMGRPSLALLNGLHRFLREYPEARSVTKLILVGSKDESTESLIKTLGLGDYVISTGRVSYEESLKYISSATICALIEGRYLEGIFLPSKLVDYIVAKKPVLALSPAVGVIADMLPCNWLVRVDVDDEIGVAHSIATFYKDFKKGTIDGRMPPEDVVCQFRSSNVAAKFLSMLSNVSKSPPLTYD